MTANFAWNSRRILRILFESDASFRLHRSSKKEIQLSKKTVSSKLVDLSAGGCALESAVFVPAGAKLNIFLDRRQLMSSGAKTKKRNFSKIVGVIRNSRQLANNKYRLGVQFEKLSSEDRKLIDEFVKNNERREDQRLNFPK